MQQGRYTYEFDFRGKTYPLDLAIVPAMEAVWLEHATRQSMLHLGHSFDTGGVEGLLAYLMLALRRAGAHDLARWETLGTVNVGETSTELRMRRIRVTPMHEDQDDAAGEGEGLDPSDPPASPSTEKPPGT